MKFGQKMNYERVFQLLALSLLLAGCASLPAQPKETIPTEDFAFSVEQTVEAHLAAQAASQTAESEKTPSATPTVTQTPTPANTSTPTLSPTPQTPFVEVSAATNCRSGPGTPYIILGVLNEGERAEVLGRSEDSDFAVINNPDSGGTCWLWLQFADLAASIGHLPLVDTPPTPTPSLTPTPSIIWADNWSIWVGPAPLTLYTMTLAHSGSSITGSFVAGGGNTVTINGALSPDYTYASGSWTSTGGSSGTFEWQRKKNVNQFIGNLDAGPNEWCGARAGASLPSPCFGP